MNLKPYLLALFLALSTYCYVPLSASPSLGAGFGGVSSARVNSMVAEAANPFAAAYNPALLAAGSKAQLSWGFQSGSVEFNPIDSVTIDSPTYRTRQGRSEIGTATLENHTASLWSLGFSYPFDLSFLGKRRAGFGVSLMGAFNKFRQFEALGPYSFSALRYGKGESQFQATVGISSSLVGDWLYFGVGLGLHISAAGNMDVVLLGDNPSGELLMDVGLNTTLKSGLYAEFDRLKVGLSFHQGIAPTITQNVTARASVLGEDTVGIPASLKAALYFIPEVWELEAQNDFGLLTLSLGLSLQRWSGYEAPLLELETQTTRGVQRNTVDTNLSFKDTVSPRASMSLPLKENRLWLHGGWEYRPSPLESTSGIANLVDADAHVLGLSVEYQLPEDNFLHLPLTLSAYGQWHLLNARQIVKEDPSYIGAPEYEFDGSGGFYGVNLKAAL